VARHQSVLRALAALAIGGLVAAATPAGAAGATVSIACGSVGVELEVCRRGAEAWAARTGNTVRVVSTPRASNEILALYQQLLSSGAGDLDVLRIDVIWSGLLARYLVDLAPAVPADEVRAHLPALVEANTVGGRLVALPWFTDVGVLYYRRDLLERHGRSVPATWDELTETARAVQDAERRAGDGRLWGLVFQGRAYEGLTCNALEWLAAFGAGPFVEPSGRIAVRDPRAARALALAASWVRTIAPPGVLGYGEEEARAAFQSGSAVFMRNWPYAWALVQAPDSAVRGKVGVAPLPAGEPGGRRAGALGGWGLGVSTRARDRAAATDLVRWLTGREQQRQAALEASLHPTIPALYDDPELLAAIPFLAELRATLAGAVARPTRGTGARYNQASSAFWNAVHEVLAGKATPEESLAALERRLTRLSRRRGWGG
jgi:trehalose/maltose transport system substrate-binding protein